MKVLLIENNAQDADFLEGLLESQKIASLQIYRAADLEEGLSKIRGFLPSIILVNFDFFSGRPDRVEKFSSESKQIPVLALIRNNDERAAAQALQMGFADYLPKASLDAELLAHWLKNAASKKDLQIALLSSQLRKALIVNAVTEGIVETDLNGRAVQTNASACRMLGRSVKEILGHSLEEILMPDTGLSPPALNPGKEMLETLRDGQLRAADQVSFYDKKGGTLTVNFVVHPVFDNNTLAGLMLFFREISDQVKVEEKLKDAIQEQLKNEQKLIEALMELKRVNERLRSTQDQLIQAEKLQSVGRLAAGVAHEVKNPLAILLQGAEYLQQTMGDADQEKASVLQDMIDAVRRADAVIKGLLDFAAPVEPMMENVDLHSVMDESLNLVKHLLMNNKVQTSKKYDSGVSPLPLDKNRMMQVFVNLFSNAIHAMPQGGDLILTTRRLDPPAGEFRVVVEIEDTGTGIPAEILDKIFDPFITTRRGLGGTGLGLSVVRSIVEMHKGEIKIENRKKNGAKVTLKF
ncbi:MAG TPA: ATP-binding protein [Verrucomicrobiae bacterium]|jgi:PAS domain S-box-containing protein|nr:ATP-binding protein [Verrucomicrobiae bacterium]